MIQIGNIVLENPVFLAPMAGVTDLPYRLLCKEQGVALSGMEMVSAKAVTCHNKATADLMEIHPKEGPVSLQLFGGEPEVLAEAAKIIEERPFAVLDLNMGCPVPKVVNNGEGSALMKDPALVFRIVDAVVKAIAKPVTVKIRKGFDDTCVNAAEVAKAAESAGAKAVTVHGRTRMQYYSGTADWEMIRRVKEAVGIPVIGNGDVTSPQKAREMMEQTGCDGVMVGRAARGNPWILGRTVRYLGSGELMKAPGLPEVREMILRHCDLQVAYKGEYTGVREMRKHISWYLTGVHGAAQMRKRVNEAGSAEELRGLVRCL